MILDAQAGIDVVGEAADGREAVALARTLRPDVCLFDIRMPGLDGIEATRQLAGPEVNEPLAVVMITTFDLDEYVHAALKAGARGFLLKDAGPALLTRAIHAAARGDALIAPSITARLLAAFADTPAGTRPRQPIEPLTSREEEVPIPVAQGWTNSEIADDLHISISTVKTHLATLMRKLDARNRVEIAMWGLRDGPHQDLTTGRASIRPIRHGCPGSDDAPTVGTDGWPSDYTPASELGRGCPAECQTGIRMGLTIGEPSQTPMWSMAIPGS